MVDKEIVIAGTIGHQMRKSAGLKKERFAVCQIASHAHIRMSAESSTEVMKSVEECVIPHKTIDMSFFREIRAETRLLLQHRGI